MTRNLLLFVCLVYFSISNAQTYSRLFNSNTNDPIAFASIWVEHTNIGTTSNENGKFTLDLNDSSNVVAFSAIGYELKKIKSGLLKDSIFLKPVTRPKQENLDGPKNRKRTITIGNYNKASIKDFFGTGKLPGTTARFFEYKKSYDNTPYLGQIKVLTHSDLSRAKFLIKLYKKDSTGKPGEYLYHENIIATARRGKRSTKVDLPPLNIQFPENGLFVAVEWLIIEDNQYTYSYISPGKKGELNDTSYEPSFGKISSSNQNHLWSLLQGCWVMFPKNVATKKFDQLALELELSN